MPAIVAQGLTRRFGEFTAADQVSFTVPRGQIFGLLGPNGAGKSTTFKMLCGLLTPSAGTGSVAGFDLRRAKANARQSLGYMAQKFSLYGDLSVRQNLTFFAGTYGLENGAAHDRARDCGFPSRAVSQRQCRNHAARLQAAAGAGLRGAP